jgi:hypothetical protein
MKVKGLRYDCDRGFDKRLDGAVKVRAIKSTSFVC